MILPGQTLKPQDKAIRIGNGLAFIESTVFAIKAGELVSEEPNIFYINNVQKRYVPEEHDFVIGIITSRLADTYRVDIGSYQQASLSILGFEGATKRNRPDLKIGNLVFGIVIVGDKNKEPEITCLEILAEEHQFGQLKGGNMFNCSISLCRKMISNEYPLLEAIGKNLKFEICIGLNGRVWIAGENCKETILISNSLVQCEFLDKKQINSVFKKLMNDLNK